MQFLLNVLFWIQTGLAWLGFEDGRLQQISGTENDIRGCSEFSSVVVEYVR